MTTKTSNHFDILLLIARPAAGKSEIIAHLKSIPLEERINRYHIGEFVELDDFPMLWTWFEEDLILSQLGHQRLHTDDDFNFLYAHLWDVLIERINLEYSKKIRDEPRFHDKKTIIIEFARGTSHGGFSRAFKHLSKDIADQLAILYLNVSWEESLRKNRSRYNPDRPDSILEHGLPDDKLEKLYRYVDWEELTSDQPDTIEIQGVSVPYVVFENEDDVTSRGGSPLGDRLAATLSQLHQKYLELKNTNEQE
ncbi:MAG: hypothetical protein MUO54_00190 [Anaerolineales bacterium]|nr:hypothetical protein [Anaerolineales bacterium]